MNKTRLLHAVRLTLRSKKQIARALRSAYLTHERGKDGCALLFFCDLPDGPAQTLPEDTELIRCVQSGVMSMAARRRDTYYFLVRKRTRDDALHAFAGENQRPCARRTLHALLTGAPYAPFEASNVSPAALIGAFDAALITDSSLIMPPDTAERMHAQLLLSGKGALRGEAFVPKRAEEPIFARLVRAGFSLLPPPPFPAWRQDDPPAAIYMPSALAAPAPKESAEGCAFVMTDAPTLSDLFARARIAYVRAPIRFLLLPAAQVVSLFLCALFGWEIPAVLTLVLPELGAFLHPAQLPCALVRLAFLPRHAITAINALLSRRLRGRKFLLTLSDSSAACAFFGGGLLLLAVYSAHALAVLLAVSLLWMGAPLLDRALALPAREKIPLSEDESRALRALCEDAFSVLSPKAADPAHLLAACAGCMLGFLEPDEAARRAEGMLPALPCARAFDAACLLVAAEFFQERMAQCDAALRGLPSSLRALVRPPEEEERGLLAALLRIALDGAETKEAVASLRRAGEGTAMDALFLPGAYMPQEDALLPLTRPHAFLRHPAQKSDPLPPDEEANRFLILACAALHAPFHTLLMRSGMIAPYAPLLSLI